MAATPAEQAVVVTLDAKALPQNVYDANDLATLEDQLIDAIKGTELGEYDGNEVGQDSAVLYLYGSDAEKLFFRIEPVLRAYPLCQGARVVIRQGKSGAEQRVVQF